MTMDKEQDGLEMDSPHLADNIRYLRKNANWSQEELADKIGLNRGNIASYETGSAKPKLCNLSKLAELFSITISDLANTGLRHMKMDNGCCQKFSAIESLSEEEVASLELVKQHHEEIVKFVNGIYHCNQFSVKKLESLSPDLGMVMANFEQLHMATQSLIKDQQHMIALIEAKLNNNGQ